MLIRRILLGCAVITVVVAAIWSSQQDTKLTSTAQPVVPTTTTATSLPSSEVPTTPAPTTGPQGPASTTGPRTVVVTAPPPPPPGFGIGARGPEVLALEQKLYELRFDPGNVDGVFDANTAFGLVAFQKVASLPRTSRATPDVVAILMGAQGFPAPLVPGGGANRVEVDVARQVLFLYQNNEIFKILPVSTGSGQRYCVDGSCDRAVTPAGSYRVFLRRRGWDKSRLGRLYNPLYFNGGIAIHGAPSVPAYPASHGCVRIPMGAAEWFPSKAPNGTPVYVKNGPSAPVPFNEPAPDGTPPQSPPPTSPPPPPPPPPPPETTTTAPATSTTTTPGQIFN